MAEMLRHNLGKALKDFGEKREIQWPADVKNLSCIEKSVIKIGDTDVYRAWKSLLSDWLSTPGCKVYLVTPFIDTTRMVDIIEIVRKNPETANIESFYLREKCPQSKTDLIKSAKQRICGKEETEMSKLIEDKIFNKIVEAKNHRHFHAKFIGCVYNNNTARVLVTSANFNSDHFGFANREWVVCHEMSGHEFEKRFIDPLKGKSAKQ